MMVAEVEPQVVAPASTEGVLGWEAVGDMELLANDSFRRYPTWDGSFNHELRRGGFWRDEMDWERSWPASSSELATASEMESGVARRAFSLSSSMF